MDNKIISLEESRGKGGACKVCGEFHKKHLACSQQALIRQVMRLEDKLRIATEATKIHSDTAKDFQKVAHQSMDALSLCQQVVMETVNGAEIWAEFEKRLESLWPQHINPDTAEHPDQAVPSTLSETSANPCTTDNGPTTAPDSSLLTEGVTPVEQNPQ